MKRVRLKTGDIIQIPLSDGTYAIAQIVMYNFKKGAPLNPLLRVLKGRYKIGEEVDLDNVDLNDELFPPVITGVIPAVREGLWNKIGFRKVKDFTYPNFIGTNWSQVTGEAGIWYLRNASGAFVIGKELPEEYKKYEYYAIISPYDIMDRIETGIRPFPYEDLIMYNKFTPITNPREMTDEDKEDLRKIVRALGKR